MLTAVKCNLAELTTKSACVPLVVSGVDRYAHVAWRTYRRHFSAISVVAVHCPGSSPPTPFPPLFPLFQQRNGCLFLLLRGDSWLGCHALPAMGAVMQLLMDVNCLLITISNFIHKISCALL